MTAGGFMTARRAGWLPLGAYRRLLWLELRRNSMLWVLPLAAALFWFDTYRSSMMFTPAPVWSLHTFFVQKGNPVGDFAPFAAGAAAWLGSRDGRRGTSDLLAATAQPRWLRLLTAWAATTCWALAGYLACMAVLYAAIAQVVTWGSPPWWPVVAGVAGVVAFTSLGFAAGAVFCGRFTAPLAAVAALLMLAGGQATSQRNTTYALLAPVQAGFNIQPGGIFYPALPDLYIVRAMFLAGLTVAAVAALGLPAAAGGRRLRSLAAAVTAVGVAAAGTAVGLAGMAQQTARGAVISAVHDAAYDRPLPYTPVCSPGAIPVCVHPAYRAYLAQVAAAVRPVVSEVAGLPGAPARVAQKATPHLGKISAIDSSSLDGSPPVLRLPLFQVVPGNFGVTKNVFGAAVRREAVAAIARFLFGSYPGHPGSPAQQAVAGALLKASGARPLPPVWEGPVTRVFGVAQPAPGTPAAAAASRFAALPAATRHAWLAAHLAALRAGRITLRELP